MRVVVFTSYGSAGGRKERKERSLWEAHGEKHPVKLAGMGVWIFGVEMLTAAAISLPAAGQMLAGICALLA